MAGKFCHLKLWHFGCQLFTKKYKKIFEHKKPETKLDSLELTKPIKYSDHLSGLWVGNTFAWKSSVCLDIFQDHLHHHQGEPDQQGQQQLVQAPHDHLQDICPVSTKCSNDVDLSGFQIFLQKVGRKTVQFEDFVFYIS